ncbi:MAG: hypothetical protein OXQ29_20295 [Rhodospirillaceae bacterium]|nr:hypothetical protein [Rhodospirillaceae bacterium]
MAPANAVSPCDFPAMAVSTHGEPAGRSATTASTIAEPPKRSAERARREIGQEGLTMAAVAN